MKPDLDVLRKAIDSCDKELVRILSDRFKVTRAVGEYKAENDLPAQDPAREAEKVSAIRSEAEQKEVDPDLVEAILVRIMERVRAEHAEIRERGRYE